MHFTGDLRTLKLPVPTGSIPLTDKYYNGKTVLTVAQYASRFVGKEVMLDVLQSHGFVGAVTYGWIELSGKSAVHIDVVQLGDDTEAFNYAYDRGHFYSGDSKVTSGNSLPGNLNGRYFVYGKPDKNGETTLKAVYFVRDIVIEVEIRLATSKPNATVVQKLAADQFARLPH